MAKQRTIRGTAIAVVHARQGAYCACKCKINYPRLNQPCDSFQQNITHAHQYSRQEIHMFEM